MTNPSVPNFKVGIGRLAVDRFDFQSHIEGTVSVGGTSFRHAAGAIDLSPQITIGGVPRSNVQDAIAELNTLVTPVPPADATTISKGIIKLAGDISGTATAISVRGLYGNPVASGVPTSGHVLTWNGSAWVGAALTNTFVAGTDLSGNNTNQTVVQLTGSGSIVNILAGQLIFANSIGPIIIHNQTTGSTKDVYIAAQSTTHANYNGGNLFLSSGSGGASGLTGSVALKVSSGSAIMLEACEPVLGQKVLALVNTNATNSTDMPPNTGNNVIYVRDATVSPTSGRPSNGSILYSEKVGGISRLNVMQSDGTAFPIGSQPNPFTWQISTNQQIYKELKFYTTVIGAATVASIIGVPTSGSVYLTVVASGKQKGTDGYGALQCTFTIGFAANSAGVINPVGTGSPVYIDSTRKTATSSAWVAPTAALVGSQVYVYTGHGAAAVDIDWFMDITIQYVINP